MIPAAAVASAGLTTHSGPSVPDASPGTTPAALAVSPFRATALDGAPLLLEQSYRLRYSVYCLERKFLPQEDYPQGLETDAYDSLSVHVGAVDASGKLFGTARLVNVPVGGPDLPLLGHCSLFADHAELYDPANKVIEVSRLAMGRSSTWGLHHGGFKRRDMREMVFRTLLKAIYQGAKRLEATHWVAATEKSLQRRVEEYGFPFRAIGPEADYSGPVAPYLMSLQEFDQVILSRRIPMLAEFLVGLEPQFQPRQDRTWEGVVFGKSSGRGHLSERIVAGL